MACNELHIVSNGKLAGALNGILLANVSSNRTEEDKLLKDVDELTQKHSKERDVGDGKSSSDEMSLLEKHGGRTDGTHNGTISGKAISLDEVNDGEVDGLLTMDINPLKFQLPPNNIFCRKEMSSFFKNRKISPPSFFTSKRRVLILPASGETYSYTEQKGESDDYNSALGTITVASSNGSSVSKNLSGASQRSSFEIGTVLTYNGHLFVNKIVDVFGDKGGLNTMKIDVSTSVSNNNDVGTKDLSGTDTPTVKDEKNNARKNEKNNGASSVLSVDEGLELLEGNMCASATGVVRLQSRKKAEMFLVRTDGFFCTREKVTESSLAFTPQAHNNGCFCGSLYLGPFYC